MQISKVIELCRHTKETAIDDDTPVHLHMCKF